MRTFFTPVHGNWLCTYVTDMVGSMDRCYVEQGLRGGDNKLSRVPIEWYEACEKVR